jgi:hypothetical protein
MACPAGRTPAQALTQPTVGPPCATGFTYQWKDEGAPMQFVLLILIGCLVFAAWASNLLERDRLLKERDDR